MPEVTGSSSGATAPAMFDLHTQSGVAELLRQLRVSSLPAATKTTIRELVLQYTQRGNDPGIREELEGMLSGLSFIPGNVPRATVDTLDHTPASEPVIEAQEKPQPAFGFSGARPVPQFQNQKIVVPKAAPDVVTVSEPPAPKPVEVTDTAPLPQATEPSTPSTPPATAPTPDVVHSAADNAARIQEIKREVIALVGNPVMLVDIDNAVGKQYMTALLEAMKKTNGGTKAEAAIAMTQLESAFVAVKEVAQRHIAGSVQTSETPAPEKVEMPASATQPPSTLVHTQPQPAPEPAPLNQTLNESPEEVTVQSTPPPGVTENLAHDVAALTESPVLEQAPDAPISEQSLEKPTLGGSPLQDIPSYGYSKPSRSVDLPPRVSPPPPPASTEAPPHKTTTSEAVPLVETRVAATDTQSQEYNGSLMSPDITVGLSQLLSEWKIFKGSGLFGMGPGGMDHPLFLNIKDNSMVSILNGTFAGASPEVQQSINDYINGWRYEQAVIPQHSETFEHFLRRVVRKVLSETNR